MNCAGHVARIWETKMHKTFWIEKLMSQLSGCALERKYRIQSAARRLAIVNGVFRDSIRLAQGGLHDNKTSGSMKGWRFID